MVVLEDRWIVPGEKDPIHENTVHVWRGCFETASQTIGSYRSCISSEERATADRFVRNSHRDRYVYAHGMLRIVLAGYVGCRPDQIQFQAGGYGKPLITEPSNGKAFNFNLSHSKDIVLIAISRGTEVGIDVEFMRDMDDVEEIAAHNFSLNERRYMRSLPAGEQKKAFFKCWTLKESFIKAIGKGLSFPLNQFSVLFSDSIPQGTIHFAGAISEQERWVAYSIDPDSDYAAAVTVEKSTKHIRFFTYY